MKRKLYLHKQGQTEVELIEVEESATVEELVARHGEPGHGAWAQDGEELVVSELVIEVVEERGHIHIGPHRQIEVTVRYEAGDKSRDFNPGTRVLTVLNWARGEHGFDVPESQRGGLGLFAANSTTPLDGAEHIGVLATEHHLRLTLAPVKRPQG
jgi:hypothetical protein